MIVKIAITFVVLAFYLKCIDGAEIKTNSGKRLKCFYPSRPENMPEDVYEKFKLSSRNLTDTNKKDFWQKFQDWWKDVLSKVKTFFEKMGNFIKNLFSGKKDKKQATTEAPPTPLPQKDSDGVICVEYDETTVNDKLETVTKAEQTTTRSMHEIESKTSEMPLTKASKTDNTIRDQTIDRKSSFTTPSEGYGQSKESEPVIIGIETKDNRVDDNKVNLYKTDPTVVKGV